jgi:hypothetical protein
MENEYKSIRKYNEEDLSNLIEINLPSNINQFSLIKKHKKIENFY